MAAGALDVSVISAVEYARDATRYLLLPDLARSYPRPAIPAARQWAAFRRVNQQFADAALQERPGQTCWP